MCLPSVMSRSRPEPRAAINHGDPGWFACSMTVHPYNGAPFMNNVLKRKFAPMTTAPSPTVTAQVGIIMGSQSDWDTMAHAARALREFGVPIETRIVSAHRTPHRLVAYATSARERGLKVIIAGAGGAAHLP